MKFSQETRRNSQKVTAHIAAFCLTEVTAGNRVISLREEGGSTDFQRLWQGKLIPEKVHSCLGPQHPPGRRQKGSSLGEADLKLRVFCPMLCLQPHELHYLPSGMVSSKALDPMTFREAQGFTLSFSLRENERLVLEDPQKRLTTM